jgi:hypothetical protein
MSGLWVVNAACVVAQRASSASAPSRSWFRSAFWRFDLCLLFSHNSIKVFLHLLELLAKLIKLIGFLRQKRCCAQRQHDLRSIELISRFHVEESAAGITDQGSGQNDSEPVEQSTGELGSDCAGGGPCSRGSKSTFDGKCDATSDGQLNPSMESNGRTEHVFVAVSI